MDEEDGKQTVRVVGARMVFPYCMGGQPRAIRALQASDGQCHRPAGDGVGEGRSESSIPELLVNDGNHARAVSVKKD